MARTLAGPAPVTSAHSTTIATTLASAVAATFALPLILAAPAPAAAQAWPAKPIRVVNPFNTGGAIDLILRPMQAMYEKELGQPIVMDYRPGAGGSVGAGMVAKERPDGYTLLGTTTGPNAVAQTLFPNLPYHVVKSFSYIAAWGGFPIVVAVHGKSPIRSLQDLLDTARAHPGKLSFGTSGIGSVGHLTGVLFARESKTELTHVGFKGASNAQTSLMGQEITMLINTLGAHIGAMEPKGPLRPLAVTSAKRSPSAPDVPTLTELGLPAVVVTNWFVLAGPAGMSPEIVNRLAKVTYTSMRDPAVRKAHALIGLETLGELTPEQISGFVAKETERWAPIVHASGAAIQ